MTTTCPGCGVAAPKHRTEPECGYLILRMRESSALFANPGRQWFDPHHGSADIRDEDFLVRAYELGTR